MLIKEIRISLFPVKHSMNTHTYPQANFMALKLSNQNFQSKNKYTLNIFEF